MASNKSVCIARKIKNDEYYTKLEDIKNEVEYYKDQLKDKVVYCPCDDPDKQNFWKYFHDHFSELKLKELISTHYVDLGNSYCSKYDGKNITKYDLIGNGDFQQDECQNIMKESDIIITNPPFSLFKAFYNQIKDLKKDCLIVGNMNAVTYKDIFPSIKDGSLKYGYTHISEYITPDGGITKKILGLQRWFTSLSVKKDYSLIPKLMKNYNPTDYPKFDNYDAINVDKTMDIPSDYFETMGVPISFLDKYNPDEFELIGTTGTCNNTGIECADNKYIPKVNGKVKYKRIFIKRR